MQDRTRILIVEDEPLVAKTLSQKVSNLGYEVVGIAATGDAGLACLESSRPDLSLTDISLQGSMDGIEFARFASERHGVPVVYVTGHADATTLERAKLTGPYGYVTKPFADHDLHVAIEMALYRHTIQRELDRSNEMLRAAAKVQATASLAAGVGHHFNNLLQIMMGYAEVARDERFNAGQVEKAAGTIIRVGRRARDVVRRMMMLSSTGQGKPAVFAVPELLEELGETVKTLAPDNVHVVIDAAGCDHAVHASRVDVENIVVNLATNAIEAMSGGGRLTVSARAVAGPSVEAGGPRAFVCIALEDSGPGLSGDVRARLFEPFFTTKNPAEGLGLGLVTAQTLAQRNRGFVEMECPPGGGTIARVLLPVSPTAAAPATKPAEEPFEYPLARRGETVLIVEDDLDVRALLVHDLRQLGYTVLDAGDGPGALEAAHSYALGIHLLLTDIVMPSMSGNELAGELTRLVPGLKVLLITGDEPPRAGARPRYPLLTKPFSKAALAVKIRAALDGPPR